MPWLPEIPLQFSWIHCFSHFRRQKLTLWYQMDAPGILGSKPSGAPLGRRQNRQTRNLITALRSSAVLATAGVRARAAASLLQLLLQKLFLIQPEWLHATHLCFHILHYSYSSLHVRSAILPLYFHARSAT